MTVNSELTWLIALPAFASPLIYLIGRLAVRLQGKRKIINPARWLAVTALLAWPHVDIARRGLDRVGMGFMGVNGVVGLLYGAVVIVATLWS